MSGVWRTGSSRRCREAEPRELAEAGMAGEEAVVELGVKHPGVGVGVFGGVPLIVPVVGVDAGEKIERGADRGILSEEPAETAKETGETVEGHRPGRAILAVHAKPERRKQYRRQHEKIAGQRAIKAEHGIGVGGAGG